MPAPANRAWIHKFRDAFRGVWRGIRGERSFHVHVFFAVAVVIAAAWFRVAVAEWCVLILCIAVVFLAEMLNSSLELLAKAGNSRPDPLIRDALDIGSGAVLLSAICAAIVGTIIFLPRLF